MLLIKPPPRISGQKKHYHHWEMTRIAPLATVLCSLVFNNLTEHDTRVKKSLKKAPVEPSSELTLSPARRALLKAAQDRLRHVYRDKRTKLLELVALPEV